MSSKTFTIKKAYMLTAIDKAGKRVYYDIDSHSGGYPYWSTYYNDSRSYDSLTKIPIIGPKDYLRNEVTRIEVLEVEIQAKVVQTTEIMSEARAKAEAEITQIRKELARKLALLEGVK
jgi:uncharacterized protein (UPF0335 family)